MAKKEHFEEYLVKNLDKAYGFAHVYVKNSHDLEDVVSESVVKALRKIHTLRDPAMMKQWFYKIIINTAFAHIKKQSKIVSNKTDYTQRFYLEDFSQPEFEELLDMMPNSDRQIVFLRFNDDLELKEIAEKLGMNESTVKTRLYRALEKLRLEINEEGRVRIKKGRSVAKNITLGIAALFISATCVFNLSPTLAAAAYDIPIIGSIVRVITFNRFEHKDNGYEAEILVPEISGLIDPELQDRLNAEFRENAEPFIGVFEQAYAELKEEFGDELVHLSIKTDYTIKTDTDRLLSLDTYIYSDVVGFVNHKFYTVDKRGGTLVMLSDLFKPDSDYITPISAYIANEMKRLNDEEDALFELEGSPFGGFTAIRFDQNFYVSEDGRLVICFDKYEVAAGVQGSPEFTIPPEVVKDILNSDLIRLPDKSLGMRESNILNTFPGVASDFREV